MSAFPNASRILLKALADPDIKHLIDTLAESWNEAQTKAVADETERCASIAESITCVYPGPVLRTEGFELAKVSIAAQIRAKSKAEDTHGA